MTRMPHTLIAGAGIGGLAAGLALLRHGFDVDLYERSAELKEVGAGLHLTPNGARVLRELGLAKAIDDVADRPKTRVMRLWNTGEGWDIPGQDLHAEARYGAPYLMMHRGDLHSILVEALRQAKPDAIHLNSECVGFTQSARDVTLELAGGRRVVGDALIAADGIKSVLRERLFGPDRPHFTGAIYWRGLAPIERVPERARTCAAGWLGPRGFITIYPVHRGELLNFNGSARRGDWQIESWTERGTHEECLNDFAGWHEEVQEIIRNFIVPYKWGSFLRDPLKHWTVGRATLLGDAAHSMLASLGQGGNSAIEDGLVLARCLAAYRDDVPHALQRYEAARLERTTRLIEASNAQSARRLNPALEDPVAARKYMDSLWSAPKVSEWYDWIFEYDAMRVPV